MGGAKGKSATKGWCWVKHGEIAVINPKKPELDDDEIVSFVPMAAVPEEVGTAKLEEERTFSQVKNGYTSFKDGDILFAKITPCMENGKVALAEGLRGGVGFGSTEFHVSRLHPDLCKEFYLHFLMSHQFRSDAQRNMSGSAGQLRVPKQYFTDVELPLPPLNEQRLIVAKIEELFSELDKGVESLKTARAQLKTYRQSLLKAAFEGCLTEQWRRDNANKLETADQLLQRIRDERETRYQQQLDDWKSAVMKWERNGKVGKKPGKPSVCKQYELYPTYKSHSLPEAWAWVPLGELIESAKNGLYKPSSDYGSGSEIVRIDDFYDGLLREDGAFKRVRVNDSEAKDYTLEDGDLLVNRVNSIEYLGKVGLVRNRHSEMLFESNMMRLRFLPDLVIPRYMRHT